jgi:hypothetical protein
LKLQALLSGLISKPKKPSSNERLQALVKYGSTVQVSHMRWEAQREDQGAKSTEQEDPNSEMHGEKSEEELEYVDLNEDEGEDEDEGDEEGDENDDEDRVMADEGEELDDDVLTEAGYDAL